MRLATKLVIQSVLDVHTPLNKDEMRTIVNKKESTQPNI